ncbi:MAG: nuclear transport factor 2 family protein [Myxococcota bacterium]
MIDHENQPRLRNAIGLYLDGIRDGHPREAIARYTGARYTQHSTGVADGREGFIAFFEPFLARNPDRDIQVIRGWEDGQYAFVHVFQSLNGGEAQWVTADFFDTDADGKIIEHWDVIAEYADSTPSGHTSIDGPTEIVDLDKTEDNKQLVRDMITDLLMRGGDVSRADQYISRDTYIQHNREVADGFEAFNALLQAEPRPLWYERIVLLVGRGNFVATLCEAKWEGQPYAQVDIFRVENGRIVEHWDNVEPCPPPEELANSGKF